jgi:hypothetical protein
MSMSNDLQNEYDRLDESSFIAHGYYCVSNSGGYEVQLSDCGDMARLRDSETGEVSDWVEIKYETAEGANEWGEVEGCEGDELIPVIPMWGGVPLDQVMRV